MAAAARLHSLISPDLYPSLAVSLTTAGLATTAWFFVYEVTKTKYSRHLSTELSLGSLSSLLLGFGIFFILLWVGVYV